MKAAISRSRLRLAWSLAILVDALQIASAPTEFGGPPIWFMEIGLDLVTMVLMCLLVGWHWTFLPSFVTKLVPFVDIAPTWTAAMFLATRTLRNEAEKKTPLPRLEDANPSSLHEPPPPSTPPR